MGILHFTKSGRVRSGGVIALPAAGRIRYRRGASSKDANGKSGIYPWNHRGEGALKSAAEQQDFQPLEKLLNIVTRCMRTNRISNRTPWRAGPISASSILSEEPDDADLLR